MKKNLMALGVATSCVMMSAVGAQAFEFETNTGSNTGPTGDIFLESVKIGDTLIKEFVYVTGADIIMNGDSNGPASSDKADGSTIGVVDETPEEAQVVQSLGNNALSSIIDGEDSGTFQIELTFDKAVNSFLFWERGKNSDLGVKIGDELFKIGRQMWGDTNVTLDTNEIQGAQEVGSYGLKVSDLGLTGKYDKITVFSKSQFNGPDFKVVGAQVPEPATMLGLGLVAGAGFLASRRKQAEA
jgi:hypothetical protein